MSSSPSTSVSTSASSSPSSSQSASSSASSSASTSASTSRSSSVSSSVSTSASTSPSADIPTEGWENMATGDHLVKSSLRRIGVLGSGETYTTQEGADALAVLNAMLDEWRIDRLTVYQQARVLYTPESEQLEIP